MQLACPDVESAVWVRSGWRIGCLPYDPCMKMLERLLQLLHMSPGLNWYGIERKGQSAQLEGCLRMPDDEPLFPTSLQNGTPPVTSTVNFFRTDIHLAGSPPSFFISFSQVDGQGCDGQGKRPSSTASPQCPSTLSLILIHSARAVLGAINSNRSIFSRPTGSCAKGRNGRQEQHQKTFRPALGSWIDSILGVASAGFGFRGSGIGCCWAGRALIGHQRLVRYFFQAIQAPARRMGLSFSRPSAWSVRSWRGGGRKTELVLAWPVDLSNGAVDLHDGGWSYPIS